MSGLVEEPGGSVIQLRPAQARTRPATDNAAGLRLTRRGRFVVAVIATLVALFGVFASQRAVAGEPGSAVAVTPRTVVAGETLWDIASSQAAPGQDVREVIDALVELNSLSGSDLQAGQELLVPAP